jgi:dTMP kinase
MAITGQRGRFIVVEGIDGAGKSTHLDFICRQLEVARGVKVLRSREPGGTPLAEKIRDLLLHQAMDAKTEVLLALAARRDHVDQLIAPALAAGTWVVCDRFTDSTRAYQGGGRGLGCEWIDRLTAELIGGLTPDRVYLFDAPAALAAQRRAERAGQGDRFEVQNEAFFDRVRNIYLEKAKTLPEVYRVIDSSQSIPDIQKMIEEDIISI